MGPAVGVEEHGKRRSVVIVGEQHRSGQSALAGVEDRDVRRRPVGSRRTRRTGARRDDPAARSVERWRCGSRSSPRRPRRCGRPRRWSPPRVPPSLHRHTSSTVASSRGLAWNVIPVLGHVDDRTHLQVDRGDRLAADQQAPGPVAIGRSSRVARRPARRDAGHELDPLVLVLVGDRRRLSPVVGSTSQHHRAALVARLDEHQRAPASVQSTWRGTGTDSRSQATSTLRAVEREHVQRDVGVGGAGRRVAHRRARLARRGRVGDVPLGRPARRRRGRRRSPCRRGSTSSRGSGPSPRRR